MVTARGMTLVAVTLVVFVGAGPAPSWSNTKCTLQPPPGASLAAEAAAVWFADIGTKTFQSELPPSEACPRTLRLSGARGERVTFQLAVRAADPTATLRGIKVSLGLGHVHSALGAARVCVYLYHSAVPRRRAPFLSINLVAS